MDSLVSMEIYYILRAKILKNEQFRKNKQVYNDPD